MTLQAQYNELRVLIDDGHELTHEDAVHELVLLIEEHAHFQDLVTSLMHFMAHVPRDVLEQTAHDVMKCENENRQHVH